MESRLPSFPSVPSDPQELLTEQLNVAVTPATMAQLQKLKRKTGIKPTDFARVAIVEKVTAVTPTGITPAEAAAIAEAKKFRIDIPSTLAAAIAEKVGGQS